MTLLKMYEYIEHHLQDFDVTLAASIYFNLMNKTTLIVSLVSSEARARELVLSQTKGKIADDVDFFKLYYIHNATIKEESKNALHNKWEELCDSTSTVAVKNACTALIQIFADKPPPSEVGELRAFEEFTKTPELDLDSIFTFILRPFAVKFFELQQQSSCDIEEPSSLCFIKALRECSKAAKSLDIIVVYWQVLFQGKPDTFKLWMRQLEPFALWMVLTKQQLRYRKPRCFQIVRYTQQVGALKDVLESFPVFDPKPPLALTLSRNEMTALVQQIQTVQFHGNMMAGVAQVILERLNVNELSRRQQQCNRLAGPVKLELVLPKFAEFHDWDIDSAKEWKYRLGNYVLVSGSDKGNQQQRAFSFHERKKAYAASTFPLTSKIGNDAALLKWNREALETRHSELVAQAAALWELPAADYAAPVLFGSNGKLGHANEQVGAGIGRADKQRRTSLGNGASRSNQMLQSAPFKKH